MTEHALTQTEPNQTKPNQLTRACSIGDLGWTEGRFEIIVGWGEVSREAFLGDH